MTEETGKLEFIENNGDDRKTASELSASIDRYLKHAICLGKIETTQSQKILLIEINEEWNSVKFYTSIIKKKDTAGILFFSFEEFPRGSKPTSGFNRSRMIREFCENSFNAVTANHKDLFSKLSQLILAIHNSDKSLTNSRRHLTTLKGRIEEQIQNGEISKKIDQLKNEGDPDFRVIETDLNYISNFYPVGGVHSTKSGHKTLRELSNSLKESGSVENAKSSLVKISCFETLYDLASIAAINPFRHKTFKILVIDDNYQDVTKDLKNITPFFPKNTKIYITDKREWGKIIEEKESEFWKGMSEGDAKLGIKEISEINDDTTFSKDDNKPLFEDDGKFKFQYVIVDLLLGHYNEGNRIINNLEKFRATFNRMYPEQRTHFDIIALSLSEEAPDIHRALNEGSLHFVPKKRIFMLPAVIAQLEKSRRVLMDRDDIFRPIKKSHNFEKLYRLPEIVKRRLQTEAFLDLPDMSEIEINVEEITGDAQIKEQKGKAIRANLEKFMKLPAEEWIKAMPKADIHCHFGGSIRGDTAFFLSLNMLIPLPGMEKTKREEYRNAAIKIIKEIIEKIAFLVEAILEINEGKLCEIHDLFHLFKIAYLVITDTNIKQEEQRKEKVNELLYEEKESNRLSTDDLKKKSPIEPKDWLKNIKNQSGDYFDDENLKTIKPEKMFISEKKFFDILKAIIKKKASDMIGEQNQEEKIAPKIQQEILRKILVPDQAVNMFNVLMGVLEGKVKGDIKKYWNRPQSITTIKGKGKEGRATERIKETLGINIKTVSEDCQYLFVKLGNPYKRTKLKKKKSPILNHFISAKRRQTSTLAEYLGGCEFAGSEQLKKKENIIAAVYDIVEKNIEDNVRLLELKFSPDGYVNEDLTLQEAVQTALLGTDLITLHSYKKGKFIRVNYILTVKRHKAPEEAALEISAVIVNREREKIYHKIKPEINKKNVEILKYEWKPSKVVGIDLAGLEKENPARNFVNDFYPLFKTSSFITIHAGEEDTAQSIWEAVYLLHANRIGHGLTLNEKLKLKDLFKNLQICVELNPISNLLTNRDIAKRYPFYDFVLEGLKVTVNTDNPAVSDSTLSEEFVKSAQLFQDHLENSNNLWMSKWEILRVLKNAFSSSFLEREEKRRLMRAVEEEIYQLIINEYGC